MPVIDHEIKMTASPERVYRALTTINGMRSGHTTDVDGTGHRQCVAVAVQGRNRRPPARGWTVYTQRG